MSENNRLTEALCAAMRGRQVNWEGPMTTQEWTNLVVLAQQQHVLPMLLESVCRCGVFLSQAEDWKREIKKQSMQITVAQTMRTAAFLEVFADMEQAGLHPIVMKGIACRVLYPVPDSRPSSDEDILVPEEEFVRAAAFLEGKGFEATDPNGSVEGDFELGFVRRDGVYLELHKSLFEPHSPALGDFNEFFADAAQRSRRLNLNGREIAILCPYDHLLYLLLHAYKHFIHSGFGVRQVCDIVLWAEFYGKEIDWLRLKEQCEQVRGWRFAQALFQIGKACLEFDLQKADMPSDLLEMDVPWQAVLTDLLEGGVFGGKDLSRKHSSTITLRTVETKRRGGRYSLRQTLFPDLEHMVKQYPYLERFPVLLPVAWTQRMLRYGAEQKQNRSDNRAVESLRIGKQRVRLLQDLGMID